MGSFGSTSWPGSVAEAKSARLVDGVLGEAVAPGREETSSTGASSGGMDFGPPLPDEPWPVRRTPIGSAASAAVGTSAGMRGAGALAGGGDGISSLRGSAVAAVGRSLTRLDSASSDFLPLDEKR